MSLVGGELLALCGSHPLSVAAMLCPLPSVESSTMLKASGELSDSAATTMQSPGDSGGSGGCAGGAGSAGGRAGGAGGGDGGELSSDAHPESTRHPNQSLAYFLETY